MSKTATLCTAENHNKNNLGLHLVNRT